MRCVCKKGGAGAPAATPRPPTPGPQNLANGGLLGWASAGPREWVHQNGQLWDATRRETSVGINNRRCRPPAWAICMYVGVLRTAGSGASMNSKKILAIITNVRERSFVLTDQKIGCAGHFEAPKDEAPCQLLLGLSPTSPPNAATSTFVRTNCRTLQEGSLKRCWLCAPKIQQVCAVPSYSDGPATSAGSRGLGVTGWTHWGARAFPSERCPKKKR